MPDQTSPTETFVPAADVNAGAAAHDTFVAQKRRATSLALAIVLGVGALTIAGFFALSSLGAATRSMGYDGATSASELVRDYAMMCREGDIDAVKAMFAPDERIGPQTVDRLSDGEVDVGGWDREIAAEEGWVPLGAYCSPSRIDVYAADDGSRAYGLVGVAPLQTSDGRIILDNVYPAVRRHDGLWYLTDGIDYGGDLVPFSIGASFSEVGMVLDEDRRLYDEILSECMTDPVAIACELSLAMGLADWPVDPNSASKTGWEIIADMSGPDESAAGRVTGGLRTYVEPRTRGMLDISVPEPRGDNEQIADITIIADEVRRIIAQVRLTYADGSWWITDVAEVVAPPSAPRLEVDVSDDDDVTALLAEWQRAREAGDVAAQHALLGPNAAPDLLAAPKLSAGPDDRPVIRTEQLFARSGTDYGVAVIVEYLSGDSSQWRETRVKFENTDTGWLLYDVAFEGSAGLP